jgi:hypothetical protein
VLYKPRRSVVPVNEKATLISIDSAVWVLLMTVLSYGMAFLYEASYVAYFGVPFLFVEVTLNSLFISAVTLVAITLAVYLVHVIVVFTVEGVLNARVPLIFSVTLAAALLIGILTLLFSLKSGFRLAVIGLVCAFST